MRVDPYLEDKKCRLHHAHEKAASEACQYAPNSWNDGRDTWRVGAVNWKAVESMVLAYLASMEASGFVLAKKAKS